MWQVFGIFVGGGWGLLQVFDLFIERGFLPEWVFGGALLALIAGLPVVLTTAYVQRGMGVRPEASPGDPEVEGEADAESTVERLFTWQKAIGGGVLAFAFLGVVTAGYMLMRVTGIGAPGTLVAQGVFEEGGEVVLADFVSSAEDVVPAQLVTEALRIDLAQSATMALLPNSAINAALERMQRNPADGLPAEVAVELAAREGAEGVISGEITRAGPAIIITSRLSAAGSGDELASFRVTADDDEGVIDAIDELSRRMRQKVGESLRSVASSEPLADVATSSLPALERYTIATQGLDRGTIAPPVAIQMFQEAVAIDTTFAAAYRGITVTIGNLGGDRALAARSIRAAYRHRDRLPERERLFTEASYHMHIGAEMEAARAFHSLLALDSTNVGAAGNLTHVYTFAGRYQEAIDVAEAVRGWDNGAYVWNQVVAYVAMGRRDDAIAAIDSFKVAMPGSPYVRMSDTHMYIALGDLEAAQRVISDMPPSSIPTIRGIEIYTEAVVSTLLGQLDAASEMMDGAERMFGESSGPSPNLTYGMVTPWMVGVIEGDRARAAEEIVKLHREVRWDELDDLQREYGLHAMTWGLLGYVEEARAMLSAFEPLVDASDPWARGGAAWGEAFVALHVGEAEAIAKVDVAAETLPCDRCSDLLRAFAYEIAGDGASAIQAYEEYLRFPFYDAPTFLLHIFPPYVHERLGALYEAEGDAAKAVEHYRAFVEAWTDADPDLQPRVRHARERAAALSAN